MTAGFQPMIDGRCLWAGRPSRLSFRFVLRVAAARDGRAF